MAEQHFEYSRNASDGSYVYYCLPENSNVEIPVRGGKRSMYTALRVMTRAILPLVLLASFAAA